MFYVDVYGAGGGRSDPSSLPVLFQNRIQICMHEYVALIAKSSSYYY